MPVEIRAEMVAQVHSLLVESGTPVAVGDTLLLLESMKMEIPVIAETGGVVLEIAVQPGDVVHEGDLLVTMQGGASS
ncbi:MAG: biotin/lipoyl-binding carrier protein [Candidatus Nanopelagicales bacterium]